MLALHIQLCNELYARVRALSIWEEAEFRYGLGGQHRFTLRSPLLRHMIDHIRCG